MSGTTSVPPIVFSPTGPVLPDEASVLAGVQADMNAAFGGNLNPGLSTPQGQLATSQSAIIADKNAQIAFLCSQFDPQTASGRWQDGLGRIYFMDRLPATATLVTATVSGLTGTTIPVGAQAVDTNGNIYTNTTAVTIPLAGNIAATFASAVTGPLACPAGTLNAIYRTIPGWDSITNAADGVLGRNVETQQEFEYRRQQTVAVNGLNTVEAIKANVFQAGGASDVYCIDNPAATSVTIGGVTLLAHSLYVCVSGGTSAAAIAKAIWDKKPPGCDYNGTTTATVSDTTYAVPYPTYTVKWTTATDTPIKFAVSIENSAYLPPNAVANIKAAIVSAFSGGDGGPVARIGNTLKASRFFGPVLSVQTPGSIVSLLSLKIGTSTATLDSVALNINQRPTIVSTDITVTLV